MCLVVSNGNMKIAIDINHPAHVHFFKNFIWEIEKKGHDILITASKKDVALKLLEDYGFDYVNMGSYGGSLPEKIVNVPIMDLKLLRAIRNFKPDIFVGLASIRAAHVSRIVRKPCIIFADEEYAYPYYNAFAEAICGFSGFKISGNKILKIDGYKELAYLHPNRFFPSLREFSDEKKFEEQDFAILRFVGWKAYHDVGRWGFDLKTKRKLIRELEKHLAVFISSEAQLPKEFENYRLRTPPDKIHDLLHYAQLLVCDSQTMTTEAAILGTPTIRYNSFVGENDMGNFIELERKYGLIFNYNDPNKVIDKVVDLIKRPNLKEEWSKKRDILLKEKIDVTSFMIWFIKNYPKSFMDMKEDSSKQYRFVS